MELCGNGYPRHTKYAVSETASIPSHHPRCTHIASELGGGSGNGRRRIGWLWFPAGTPAAAARVAEPDESD